MVCDTLAWLCDRYLYASQIAAAAAAAALLSVLPREESFCFRAWAGEKTKTREQKHIPIRLSCQPRNSPRLSSMCTSPGVGARPC